jgi:two-component system response regulator HydG
MTVRSMNGSEMPSAPRVRVLLAEDHVELAEMLADGLADAGFDAVAVPSGRKALEKLRAEKFDALVTDLRMQSLDGLELLSESRKIDPSRPVIVMTAYGAVDTAIESIRRGAYHYLTKPFKVEELVIFLRRALDEQTLRREAAALRRVVREQGGVPPILGQSAAMKKVFDVVERVASVDVPVLVLGETGTGKGLLAQTLHARSPRAAMPFVSVNCAALPDALLESELFGHAKGAFTGATSARAGLFVEADGGTLVLDEIGELPLALQAKLLHALERGTVRPVGESHERKVDVRIIAATHRDLHGAAQRGTFREDLLYRLDVVTIELPALRQRREDIPALIDHFLRVALQRYEHSSVARIAPDAMERLVAYRWPGNVRELAHTIERLVLLGRGAEVSVADLPTAITAAANSAESMEPTGAGEARFGGDVVPIRELQRQYAAWALASLGGNRSRTAERLGIDRGTLARWLADEPDDGERS